jgi:hypothetical protein
MTPTITWSLDGVSLSGYTKADTSVLYGVGWYVQWPGPAFSIPGFRGENVTVPDLPGRVHVDKVADQRVFILPMTVYGLISGGTADNGTDLPTNLDKLTALLCQPGLHTLSYTWGSVTRTAQVSMSPEVQLQPDGPGKYNLAPQFVMAGVWWEDTGALDTTGVVTIDNVSKTLTLTNTGTVDNRRAVITLNGLLHSPTVLSVPYKGVTYSLTISALLGTGYRFTIDCAAHSMLLTHPGYPAFVTQDYTVYLVASHAPIWLPIAASPAVTGGVNTLTLTCTAPGTGADTPDITVSCVPQFVR